MEDIKNYLLAELEDIFKKAGIPAFRARQIFTWIYRKNVLDFDEMTDLDKRTKEFVSAKFKTRSLECLDVKKSRDRTCKCAFRVDKNTVIEAVHIPHLKKRDTFCISSQAGCRYRCVFCASGKNWFKRNLSAGEITEQVLQLWKITGKAPTNIVFMGVGEPLDNFDNVLKSITILNAVWGLGISQRRISLSTAGVIPAIRKLAERKMQIELAISLHSADNQVRSRLMPVNREYPLQEVIRAARDYCRKTHREITFEYIVFRGLNDRQEDARLLKQLLKGFLFKINVIPYNAIGGTEGLDVPSPEELRSFVNRLKGEGMKVFVRKPRGQDIKGACGQLRMELMKGAK